MMLDTAKIDADGHPTYFYPMQTGPTVGANIVGQVRGDAGKTL